MASLLDATSGSKIISHTIFAGRFAGKKVEFDRSKLNDVETVLVLWPHRARAHNEKTLNSFKPGDKYKVSGLQKAEIILNGWATLDLQAELPECKKRTIEQAKESKKASLKSMHQLVIEQNESIVSALEKLGRAMESISEKLGKK